MIFNSQLFGISLATTLMMGVTCVESAVINVTTTLDDAIDDSTIESFCMKKEGKCSLRAAVQLANQSMEEDVIQLSAGIYKLTLPGVDEDHNKTGDLDIQSNLIIQGDDAGTTIIDGNQMDRIFHHHRGRFHINNVTLQHANIEQQDGGAIYSLNAGDYDIFVKDSIIRSNSARRGAAIFHVNEDSLVYGRLSINNSVIEDNFSDGYGHTVMVYQGSSFSLVDSVYQKNRGVFLIQSNKIQFAKTEIIENNMDGFDLLALACQAGKSDIVIQNTQISDNRVGAEGRGKVLQVSSLPDVDCTVSIHQSQLTDNSAWGILGFNLSKFFGKTMYVNATHSLIARNSQPYRGSGEESNLFAPVTIEDYASKSMGSSFYFDHISIVNNDFSNHGLVGAISVLGDGSNPRFTMIDGLISGNKAKRHMIYSGGIEKASVEIFNPHVNLFNSRIVNNDVEFKGYGTLRSLNGKIMLNQVMLTETQNCFDMENVILLGLEQNTLLDSHCDLNQSIEH